MKMSQELAKSHATSAVQALQPEAIQNRLEEWCTQKDLDAVLISAQDAFLSEYTPLSSNQRFHLSGFTGSTGDGLFLTRGCANAVAARARFHLFVDGRYHLQADQETQPQCVEVHKFTLASGMDEAMFSWIEQVFPKGTRLAVDTQRISWGRWQALQSLAASGKIILKAFANGEIAQALAAPGWNINRKIVNLSPAVTGRSAEANLSQLRTQIARTVAGERWVYATCLSDDAAWLLNARGYHLPQLSSFLAYTFVTTDACIVHLPEESAGCEIELENLPNLIVTRGSLQNAWKELKMSSASGPQVSRICFSGRAMNAALPQELLNLFPNAVLMADEHHIEHLRVQKTTEELNSIRQSFLRSSRAIAKTLRWAKECGRNNSSLSEIELAERIRSEYAAEGALELSFKTISGFAENGAVIHYSKPSQDKKAQQGDLLLLDSGAYYNEGFATDCTRVAAYADGPQKVQPWQREIYTLTLKACLSGLRATFDLQTPCRDIDALVRDQVKAKGYDYAHGTGHGIGIHVHENGIRLSPVSAYTFTENAVVSVEPGIYLANKGGVRIENVAIVVPRDAAEKGGHTHTFENVVFVGYDWDLIDLSLLSDQDKQDLIAYERKCLSLGTAVTDCPLL